MVQQQVPAPSHREAGSWWAEGSWPREATAAGLSSPSSHPHAHPKPAPPLLPRCPSLVPFLARITAGSPFLQEEREVPLPPFRLTFTLPFAHVPQDLSLEAVMFPEKMSKGMLRGSRDKEAMAVPEEGPTQPGTSPTFILQETSL